MKNLNLLKIVLLFTILNFSLSQLSGKYINLGFPAMDIGVGSEGDACVIGLDNFVYCYDFMDDDWIRIQTLNIDGVTRLDVDDDGNVYIVSPCGVYYLDCENRWIRLPGAATDIGVGVDFTVWKIGDDKILVQNTGDTDKQTNYGVWKLICDCKCLCLCRRRCIRFRLRDYDPCSNDGKPPKCYWFRTDGYGINIDVFPNGDAVFTVKTDSAAHTTLKTINHHGMYFRDYKCGTNDFGLFANDVTVGNTGVVYVTDSNSDVYKCHQNSSWQQVGLTFIDLYTDPDPDVTSCPADKLRANRISAGPYNQFWFIHTDVRSATPTSCELILSNKVFTASRFIYVDAVPKNFVNFITFKSKEGSGTETGTSTAVAPA